MTRSSVAWSRNVVNRANQSQTEVRAVRASAHSPAVVPVERRGLEQLSVGVAVELEQVRAHGVGCAPVALEVAVEVVDGHGHRPYTGAGGAGGASDPASAGTGTSSEPSFRMPVEHVVHEPHEVLVVPGVLRHRDRVRLVLQWLPEEARVVLLLLGLEAGEDGVVARDRVDLTVLERHQAVGAGVDGVDLAPSGPAAGSW